jgi:hypothetical protein
MKKSGRKLLFYSALIALLITSKTDLTAQNKEVSSMELQRKELMTLFADNKNSLQKVATENMLTDEQCQNWVGKRTILQKLFTQLDDCTGDSLYTIFFENGLIIKEGLGDELFFVGEFNTVDKEFFTGQPKKQIKELLGIPAQESDEVLVYKKKLHPEIAYYEEKKYDESVILFFKESKLIGLWVSFYMIC